MKKYFILPIIILFSCSTEKINSVSHLDGITAVKFMYANDYSSAINEDSFWSVSEEHAKMFINVSDSHFFIENIKSFKKTDASSFGVLKYAFITHDRHKQDTIYADYGLTNWKYKDQYYSGIKDTYVEDLKTRYGFFKDCW